MPDNQNIDAWDEPLGVARSAPAIDGLNRGAAPDKDADPRPGLRVRFKGGVTLVDFRNTDALFESEAICTLFACLHRLVNDGHIQLVLNLAEVQYASGALLGSLASLHRRVGKTRGFMRLYGLNPVVRDAIKICRLDTEFEIYNGEAEALPAGSEAVGSGVERSRQCCLGPFPLKTSASRVN
ncbi:MAG: STAS domain-containing protein [Isosphaerales bacterium]